MSSRRSALLEWLGFQAVWFVCALGAARDMSWPGILASGAFVSVVLHSKRWASCDVAAVVVSGVVGLAIETCILSLGLVRFSAQWPLAWLAPAWIVALWVAFGATLPMMAGWLGKTGAAVSAVAGAAAGPLAYWAGMKLGALEFPTSMPTALFVIAVLWAVTLPALLEFYGRRLRAS